MGKSKNLERRNTHRVKDEVSILRIFQKKLKFNIGKYFAKWISKSWKTQKLIIAVRNLFNWYVYSYRRFAKEVIEVLLFLTVCSCHVTYAFQSQSTLYSCLNVKELLARSRHEIWSLSDYNWTRTQNCLVRKRTLNHVIKLALSVPLWTKWIWVRV